MSKGARSIAIFSLLALSLTLVPFNHASLSEQPQSVHKHNVKSDDDLPLYVGVQTREEAQFVIREIDGEATCKTASTPEELNLFKHQDRDFELKQISHVGEGIRSEATGLTILLRATAQLDANPTAKAAFVAAAAKWEALIQNPITIIIDVDFGPTRFGSPFGGSDVLGATSVQGVGSTTNFPDIRTRLISHSSSAAETTLYNALPTGTVGTDIGPTAGILAPTALFRALGVLSAVADPTTETPTLGIPPRIGFNSAFGFDFDPSNGVDASKTDFDSVAVHEIGHALGFSSNVGSKELAGRGSDPTFLAVMDLFRFRPGTSLATFPTANRILASGGEQRLFTGVSDVALSTGRPDGTAGDGEQASHWKDDAQTGVFIGIMDPTIARGVHQTITNNDLAAYDLFGYSLMGSAPPPIDDAVVLTSGAAAMGSISAPDAGSGLLGATQYAIQVPAGTTQLKIDLTGNQDVDLYARFGAKIVIQGGGPVADFRSESDNMVESITINSATSPPLQPGNYYIAVGNFGPGAATYSVTATVTGGGGTPSGTAPVVTNLTASLAGNTLSFTGTFTDPDADVAQAQSSLLNGAGQVVASINPFSVPFAGAATANFTVNIGGLAPFGSAVKATLVLIDASGNRSTSQTVDFSQADSGGPTIKNVTVSGSKMVIKGTNLSGSLIIEINGVDVTTVDVGSNKAKVKGVTASLRAGDNRIRVRHGTLRSNIFVFAN